MSTITRIAAGKRNPSRANVYLDGKFALALSIDEAVKHHLKVDRELTETEVETLKSQDSADKVYGKILNFLSFRPRSVKEVRDRLYQYEVRETSAQNTIIARLQKQGYLDDVAFAKWFIESRNTQGRRSPRMIKQELAAKGISREVLAQVMVGVQDEKETIRGILAKKLGDPHRLESSERQKITTYLARLGFAWDKISEVVKRFESE